MDPGEIITLRKFILSRYLPGRERRAWLKWLEKKAALLANDQLPKKASDKGEREREDN